MSARYWSHSKQAWSDIAQMREFHVLNAINVLRRKEATEGLTDGENGEQEQLAALIARANSQGWGKQP